MKKKKMLLIVCIFILIVGVCIKGYGQSAMTENKAKEIAMDSLNKYFNIKIEEKKFKTIAQFCEKTYASSTPVWKINWENEQIDVEVSVDAENGKIIHFENFKKIENAEKETGVEIRKEEAKKIVENLLKRMNPNEFKEIRLRDNQQYYFDYRGIVNGIDFDDNKIGVGIESKTGDIVSYNMEWDNDLHFEEAKDVIGKDKAKELLKKYANINLMEKNEGENKKPRLIYDNLSDENLINAKKGTLVDYCEGTEIKFKDISKEEKEEIFKTTKKSKASNKIITAKEAEKIVKDVFKEIFKEEYVLEDLILEDSKTGCRNTKKAWIAHFIKKNDNKKGELVIDAVTKEIILATKETTMDEKKNMDTKMNWEEGYNKAVELIRRYYPEKIMEIETKKKYPKGYEYSEFSNKEDTYFFSRVVNKLPIDTNGIEISMDLETGEVSSLEFDWDENLNFKEIYEVIEKEKAENIYFEYYEARLFYKKFMNKQGEKKVTLVYDLRPLNGKSIQLDALDGTVLIEK